MIMMNCKIISRYAGDAPCGLHNDEALASIAKCAHRYAQHKVKGKRGTISWMFRTSTKWSTQGFRSTLISYKNVLASIYSLIENFKFSNVAPSMNMSCESLLRNSMNELVGLSMLCTLLSSKRVLASQFSYTDYRVT